MANRDGFYPSFLTNRHSAHMGYPFHIRPIRHRIYVSHAIAYSIKKGREIIIFRLLGTEGTLRVRRYFFSFTFRQSYATKEHTVGCCTVTHFNVILHRPVLFANTSLVTAIP